MANPLELNVSVVLALPEKQQVVELTVHDGCTARQAVLLAVQKGLNFADSGVAPETAPLGIFGHQVKDGQIVQLGDRVEIYRALEQDPKEWRRRKAALDN